MSVSKPILTRAIAASAVFHLSVGYGAAEASPLEAYAPSGITRC